MKPILVGTRETVRFDQLSSLLLYENVENEEYPYHWHAPLEIIMPLENSYRVDCGQKSFLLNENDILLIAPGTLHFCHASSGRRLILQANLSVFSTFNNFDSLISFLQPHFLLTRETCPEIHEECVQLLLRITESYGNQVPVRELAVNSDLLRLLYIVGKYYTEQKSLQTEYYPNKRMEYMDKFMQVCDYISEHCVENLTLEETADRVGFSKYHFSRLFKDFTGTTFYKYLNTCRIAKAELMLMDMTTNITDVATGCGFNSVSSFLRMFRIIKGCTPTEFRKMQQIYTDQFAPRQNES